MNKTSLIIFIILILIVGVFLVVSYALPRTAVSPTADQYAISGQNIPDVAATVILSDQGFAPQTITIRSGESVTWINNSSDRMLVASDPHPAHTDLPGFDQGTIANPGSSWTYRFNSVGTHTYHDHINPNLVGTVIVE